VCSKRIDEIGLSVRTPDVSIEDIELEHSFEARKEGVLLTSISQAALRNVLPSGDSTHPQWKH
jgi:hypothetical protein